MRTNFLLILGIIFSSIFNFTANESPESWIIMPPAPIFRFIENCKLHRQAADAGAISWSEYSHGIDVDAANEFLMFVLVMILIGRELFKKPVSKYFTFVFLAIFLLSFIHKLSRGGWSLGVCGTWLFLISIFGLLAWQYVQAKKSNSSVSA